MFVNEEITLFKFWPSLFQNSQNPRYVICERSQQFPGKKTNNNKREISENY